jgi:hypothetical protein
VRQVGAVYRGSQQRSLSPELTRLPSATAPARTLIYIDNHIYAGNRYIVMK